MKQEKIIDALNYFKRRKEMYLDDLAQKRENVAIVALEKQIAKKPINGATFKHIGQCPDCKHVISTRSASSNCQYCGQKLDWGKE